MPATCYYVCPPTSANVDIVKLHSRKFTSLHVPPGNPPSMHEVDIFHARRNARSTWVVISSARRPSLPNSTPLSSRMRARPSLSLRQKIPAAPAVQHYSHSSTHRIDTFNWAAKVPQSAAGPCPQAGALFSKRYLSVALARSSQFFRHLLPSYKFASLRLLSQFLTCVPTHRSFFPLLLSDKQVLPFSFSYCPTAASGASPLRSPSVRRKTLRTSRIGSSPLKLTRKSSILRTRAFLGPLLPNCLSGCFALLSPSSTKQSLQDSEQVG